jgi:hypothetical protein
VRLKKDITNLITTWNKMVTIFFSSDTFYAEFGKQSEITRTGANLIALSIQQNFIAIIGKM